MTTPRRPAGVLLLGLAMAGVLAIAGCTPEDTTPAWTPPAETPTSTPMPETTGLPEPKSEKEAVAAAEDVIQRYVAARAEVNKSDSDDTAPLEAVAIGPALQRAIDDKARKIADKTSVEGEIKFEPTAGYAAELRAPDGTSYPFGTAVITGCQDGSDYKIFNPDGSPAQQPTELRNVIELTTIWEPGTGTWFVRDAVAPGPTC